MLNKLPIADSSFFNLRMKNAIYVDKTKFVYNLAINDQPRVLTRPRRFGKSTLLSTLKELFLHGVKPFIDPDTGKLHESCFKGLAIENLWTDPEEYLVLQLDFRDLNEQCSSIKDFELNLLDELDAFAQEHHLTLCKEALSLNSKFQDLLLKLPKHKLVLLIDEYDAPFLACLNNQDKLQQTTLWMQNFYSVIKSSQEKFRCIFAVGITPLQSLKLSTAVSNFSDISFDHNFATCCGFTHQELKQYFKNHLLFATAKNSHCTLDTVTSEQIEHFLDYLALWYDGFCFDQKQSNKVFSTWSVLRFFSDEDALLQPYWMAERSVLMPSLLKNTIKRLNLPKLWPTLASGEFKLSFAEFMEAGLFSPQESNHYALFYQTGYLTLTRPFLNGGKISLRLTNQETRIAFATFLAERLYATSDNNTPQLMGPDYAAKAQQVLASLDANKIKQLFSSLFATLPYQHYPVVNESIVSGLLAFYLIGAGLAPHCEVSENLGRADAEVNLPQSNITLVFEYKYEQSADPAILDTKLQEAIAKIKSRDYGNHAGNLAKIARFALVFCGNEKVRNIARLSLVDVLNKNIVKN